MRDRVDAPGTPWAQDGQWYLHLFDSSQPDLNWESAEVRAEFEDVLRFWLDRGVDGFRVDVAHGLVKAAGLPDWTGDVHMVSGADDEGAEPGTMPSRPPMFDQDGVHEIYRDWRRLVDDYPGERILVAEAWVDPLERLARYVRADEMHQAFNFSYLVTLWDGAALRQVIAHSFEVNDAVGAPTTWVLSNHDVVRHASRLGLAETGKGPKGIGAGDPQPDRELGLRRARAASLLMLALPGSAYLYQGEELGLPEHTSLPDEAREDPAFFRTAGAEKGRDGCRVPIPWEAEAPGYGFSATGETWLPQPADWGAYAVDAQRDVPGSTLELYREALRLRRELGLATATLREKPGPSGKQTIALLSDDPEDGRPDVLVLTNLGDEPVELPPPGWRVLLASTELPGSSTLTSADTASQGTGQRKPTDQDDPTGRISPPDQSEPVLIPADTTVWARRD